MITTCIAKVAGPFLNLTFHPLSGIMIPGSEARTHINSLTFLQVEPDISSELNVCAGQFAPHSHIGALICSVGSYLSSMNNVGMSMVPQNNKV